VDIPNNILDNIKREYRFITEQYPTIKSSYEGLALVEQGFEQLKTSVFKHTNQEFVSVVRLKDFDYLTIGSEALWLATVATRFIADICPQWK